jgi:hypothetical protein
MAGGELAEVGEDGDGEGGEESGRHGQWWGRGRQSWGRKDLLCFFSLFLQPK